MTREKIGFKACVDAIGEDFARAHRDNMVFSHGETELGLFCFLGISVTELTSDSLCLSSHAEEWDYYASCYVKDNNEVVMDKCKLPALV